MTTGDKIKQARESMGMTQAYLGRSVGVSQNLVSNWETGRLTPNIRIVERLANVLNIEPEELVGNNGTAPMKAEDTDEKVARLNGAIVQKNAKIKELEDTICDQWEEIERLKKALAKQEETQAAQVNTAIQDVVKLQQENDFYAKKYRATIDEAWNLLGVLLDKGRGAAV